MSAYFGPYLSHTGLTASWNGFLSAEISMIWMPAALRLVHRLLFVLRPQHALFQLRLAAELDQQRLVVLRQRVPGLLREHEHLRHDQVLVDRVELRDLIVVVEHEARRVVLGAVDHAGLQRVEHLVVAHRDAVAAERVHHVDEHRVAHDAELHALEVGDGLDRLLGVVEAARAGIHPAQRRQARLADCW